MDKPVRDPSWPTDGGDVASNSFCRTHGVPQTKIIRARSAFIGDRAIPAINCIDVCKLGLLGGSRQHCDLEADDCRKAVVWLELDPLLARKGVHEAPAVA